MRLVEELILQIRKDSDNEDYSSTNGIPTAQISQYLNDAQDRLQALITAEHPMAFVTEETVSLVANQEAYSLTGDLFLGSRIHSVDYSHSGQTRDYVPLKQRTLKERFYGNPGTPEFYLRRNNSILLQPAPNTSSGSIRVNYEARVKRLDFRRAKVSSTTGTPITAITVTEGDASLADIVKGQYLTVVDEYGAQTAVSIPCDSGSTTTSIAINNHTLGSGETITAGDYVLFGSNSTSVSELDEICERYLVCYAVWKLLRKDNSTEASSWRDELAAMEVDIIAAYGEPDMDVKYIPVLDEDGL